jgi:hypothetical protein
VTEVNQQRGHWSRVDMIIDSARNELMRQESIGEGSVQSAIAVILAERLANIVNLHILWGRPSRSNWCAECGETVIYPAACSTTRLAFGEELS